MEKITLNLNIKEFASLLKKLPGKDSRKFLEAMEDEQFDTLFKSELPGDATDPVAKAKSLGEKVLKDTKSLAEACSTLTYTPLDYTDESSVFSATSEQQKAFEKIELASGATPAEAKASAERSMHDLKSIARYPSFLPTPMKPEDVVDLMRENLNPTEQEEKLNEVRDRIEDKSFNDEMSEFFMDMEFNTDEPYPASSSDDEQEEESVEPNFLEEPAPVRWINSGAMNSRLANITEHESHNSYLSLIKRLSEYKDAMRTPGDSVFASLHATFPNFAEVIDFYKSQFRLCKLTGKRRISPVLLLGEPGIGKTHFAKNIARLLGTGYSFIDMASATDTWVLSGLDVSWRGAKAGKIFESMVASSTTSPVVLLDEIEKCHRSERNPASVLYQLLEETTAKEFIDEFVAVPADLSSIIYIACANSLDGIPQALQTRFRIFNVQAPMGEQHARVMQTVYQEEIDQATLFQPILSPEILSILAPLSVREAKQKISEAIGKSLLEMTSDEIEQKTANGEQVCIEPRHFTVTAPKSRKLGF